MSVSEVLKVSFEGLKKLRVEGVQDEPVTEFNKAIVLRPRQDPKEDVSSSGPLRI